VAVRLANDEIVLVFGQLSLSEERLESALAIRVPPRGVRSFLESLDQMHSPSIGDIVTRNSILPGTLADAKRDATQVVKLSSNVIQVALSGREAALSFYQLAADSVAKVLRTSDTVLLDPIVRVDIKTADFLAIRDSLIEFEKRLPSEER
jgi:hypothetical protein